MRLCQHASLKPRAWNSLLIPPTQPYAHSSRLGRWDSVFGSHGTSVHTLAFDTSQAVLLHASLWAGRASGGHAGGGAFEGGPAPCHHATALFIWLLFMWVVQGYRAVTALNSLLGGALWMLPDSDEQALLALSMAAWFLITPVFNLLKSTWATTRAQYLHVVLLPIGQVPKLTTNGQAAAQAMH
eukprot:CAMPEP_0174704832 /NCGR_PEP_ID=MMETSP1094-20130205/8273_1 /TAXON_ID=156173 /ORGANISM="Chrysochromulina brevifilum, Strain UTEX LB 985" /LENGTH=183 /DNA_ID=CAMNT_0015902923 /DNA_START=32 /DNA_END=583 /DNA_ORIENTATION=-